MWHRNMCTLLQMSLKVMRRSEIIISIRGIKAHGGPDLQIIGTSNDRSLSAVSPKTMFLNTRVLFKSNKAKLELIF